MSNLFNQFQNLLPSDRVSVVSITLVNSDGTSIGTTSQGVSVTLIGDTVAAGKNAYVRGSEITGEAPDITPTEVFV